MPQAVKNKNPEPELSLQPPVPSPKLPEWWKSSQADAWKAFQAEPFPARKDERFRFTDFSKIRFDGLRYESRIGETARQEIIQRSLKARESKPSSGRFLFANETLVESQPLSQELAQKGVVWLPLAEAIVKHPELVKKYFMTQDPTLSAKKFIHLHRAFCAAGSFLYVPKNVNIEHPLEAHYWLTESDLTLFPHTLIVTEANSQVEMIDFYQSLDPQASGAAFGVTDLHAGTGSKIRYVASQNWGSNMISFQSQSVTVERDASTVALNLNLGGAYARLESKSRMVGSGGRSDMLSLTLSTGKQEFDQRTFQEHAAPHTTSDLLYKNALCDDSRTIFSGMIEVDPVAQQTDAYQSNRNLLLSDTAETNSLPGLEINANDVRCTHGSTSGQLDESEMFYLLSRGIPKTEARRLFILGFFQEVLLRLKDERIEQELLELIDTKYIHTTKS